MIMEETRRRSYTIIEPRCTWSRAEDCDTLTVDVSGFKEEQLRVLANTRRKLKISGERHLDGNRWARFVKEFRIPKSCHIKSIKATFNKEDQVLNVILPKSTHQVKSQEQPTQVSEPPVDHKTSEKTDSSDSQARKATDEKNLEGSSKGAVQRAEESIKGEQETVPTKNERDSGKRDEEFTKENDKPAVNERDSSKRAEEITKENEKPTENERDSRKRDEELTKEIETSQEANASKKRRKWYAGLVRWFNKIKAFMLYVVVPILIIVGVVTYLM
ncbi:inactive protein RESTRICTED TEV MOVEMENT 2 [Ananas comosus]|uniref:Inactive protein RESTRICTED TEV MOVEMENT 2 n=1 Tax=Ananas comosus TaxID=4615 RepID=A0A6P5F7S2_ANACO|nr:inactive protein RESTRICTED TEV MOVEMENT 2 [Ananas comosus]